MRPPEDWRAARFTLGTAAVTAAAWVLAVLFRLEQPAVQLLGFIPAGAVDVVAVAVKPLTATLVHANLAHLGFNLLILLFCGRAVEAILGGRGMAILYVVGAYAAAGAHYLLQPDSPVPMVGASGAISSVIGAYALLFGRNRVKLASPAAATLVHVLWLAAAWVGLQLLIGYAATGAGAMIAVGAHIGGFLAGLLLAKPLLLLRWRGA